VADKKYFEWLGDPDSQKLPFVNRELAGVMFSGPNHIGVTGDKDKIKFFEESDWFKVSTQTAFEINGGLDPEDVIESEDIGTQENSSDLGTQNPDETPE
jgi:hypothetical protein